MALKLKLTADTSDYDRKVGKSNTITTAMGTAMGVLTAQAIPALGRALGDLVGRTGQVASMTSGFEHLTEAAGLSADTLLEGMRPATLGLIDDMKLMEATNNALTLGIVRSEEEWIGLTESATVLGRVLGLDTTQAIDSLVIGLGRQSKLVLDNLGIIVDTEGAYKSFAAQMGRTVASLDDAEKKTAFMNAAMLAIKDAAERAGPPVLTLADRVGQAQTKFKNWGDEMITVLNESPAFNKAMDAIAEAFGGVGGVLDGLVVSFQENLPGAVVFALEAIDFLQKGVFGLRVAFELATTGILQLWDGMIFGINAGVALGLRAFATYMQALGEIQGLQDGAKLALDLYVGSLHGFADTLDKRANTAMDRAIVRSDEMNASIAEAAEQSANLSLGIEALIIDIKNAEGATKDLAGANEQLITSFEQIILTAGGAQNMMAAVAGIPGAAGGFATSGSVFGGSTGDLPSIGGFDLGSIFGGSGGLSIPGFGGGSFDLGSLFGGGSGGGFDLGSLFGSGGFDIGGILNSFTSFLPFGGLASLATAGITSLVGWISGIGGPDEAELEAREIQSSFERMVDGMLNDRQKIEAGGVQWKENNIVIRDTMLALGFSIDDVHATWDRFSDAAKDPVIAAEMERTYGGFFDDLNKKMEETGLSWDELRSQVLDGYAEASDEAVSFTGTTIEEIQNQIESVQSELSGATGETKDNLEDMLADLQLQLKTALDPELITDDFDAINDHFKNHPIEIPIKPMLADSDIDDLAGEVRRRWIEEDRSVRGSPR